MSIYNCHKQEPQPWMSYINPNMITYSGKCCPQLVTTTDRLLPFQIISNGVYVRAEISPYGEDTWTEITIPVSSVYTDGFFIHSYIGSLLESELLCGVYDFRVIAGETWWFEPIKIEDFTISENTLTVRDDLMTPFKISEQIIDTTPLIAPCDMILPFMFRTENVTSGTITVYMVDESGTETEITITVSTAVIDGMTYYWHSEEYLYPFLSCGRYYLKIVDGANTYYSVPFVPECGISDIPDGYKVLRDFNGCVIRNGEGAIEYEEASDIREPEPIPVYEDLIISNISNSTSDHYNDYYGEGLHYLQEFKITNSKLLYSVSLLLPDPLPRYFGNPDYNLKMTIFSSVDALPVSLIADSIDLIHSSEWFTERVIKFYFNDVNLIAGNYCFIITYQDVVRFDNSNYIQFHFSTLNQYPDGAIGIKPASSSTWTLSFTSDLRSLVTFVTYI